MSNQALLEDVRKIGQDYPNIHKVLIKARNCEEITEYDIDVMTEEFLNPDAKPLQPYVAAQIYTAAEHMTAFAKNLSKYVAPFVSECPHTAAWLYRNRYHEEMAVWINSLVQQRRIQFFLPRNVEDEIQQHLKAVLTVAGLYQVVCETLHIDPERPQDLIAWFRPPVAEEEY